ncbi:tRNA(Ile)-lysidine synthase [Linum perenne]
MVLMLLARVVDALMDSWQYLIIDHGLRAESKEEARTVSFRVSKMGIRCEIAECNLSDGRPKQGHLQAAAREMRYQMFQKVCIQHQIGVLLIAHHADD